MQKFVQGAGRLGRNVVVLVGVVGGKVVVMCAVEAGTGRRPQVVATMGQEKSVWRERRVVVRVV